MREKYVECRKQLYEDIRHDKLPMQHQLAARDDIARFLAWLFSHIKVRFLRLLPGHS